MERKAPARRPDPGVHNQTEIAGVLADVLMDQKAKAKARQHVKAPRARQAGPAKKWALMGFAALSLYLWFGSPGFLSTSGDNPVAPELLAAGARMEIYLQAIRVEEFRKREGRLPDSLSELGDPPSGIQFERVGSDLYRLAVARPEGVVSYMSSDPLERFLGNALEVIGGAE